MTFILNNPHLVQLVVLAAEADPLNVLLNYGGLGLGILLFISGRLHTTGELDDARAQRDKAIDTADRLREQLLATVPTLGRNASVLEALLEAQAPASDAELLRQVLAELKARKL